MAHVMLSAFSDGYKTPQLWNIWTTLALPSFVLLRNLALQKISHTNFICEWSHNSHEVIFHIYHGLFSHSACVFKFTCFFLFLMLIEHAVLLWFMWFSHRNNSFFFQMITLDLISQSFSKVKCKCLRNSNRTKWMSISYKWPDVYLAPLKGKAHRTVMTSKRQKKILLRLLRHETFSWS